MKKQSIIALIALLASATSLWAAEQPSGYYSRAEGKNKAALLTALKSIIGSHTQIGYDNLWDAYKKTDVYTGSNGKQYYYDLYSNFPYEVGKYENKQYNNVGQSINREHMVPQSWFDSASPMKSDIFHVIPTDGYVNNQRSNFPYGECANGTRITNGQYHGRGKLGTCTTTGYTGKVWEPDDDIKGDCARAYFYMAACYNDKIASWKSQTATAVFAGNSYPGFTDWHIEMLLRWHRLDPVDEREVERNNAAYDVQKNRNPFIDHPELAEYIWGVHKESAWSETTTPALTSPANGTTFAIDAALLGSSVTLPVTVSGVNLTSDLAVTVQGEGFEASASTIAAASANGGTTLTITFTAATAGEHTGTLKLSSSEVESTCTITAIAIDTVSNLTATAASLTSLDASWTAAQGAASYTLRVLAEGTTPADDPQQLGELLLSKDFTNDNTGWTVTSGNREPSQPGYIKIGTSSRAGSITSPSFDTSGANGTVTVKVKAKPWPNDKSVQMLISATGTSTVTIGMPDASSDSIYTAVLTGIGNPAQLKIATAEKSKRVLIKSIEVYEGQEGAASSRRAVTETGDSTSRTITGITGTSCTVRDLKSGGTFSVQVQAVYNGQQSATSPWSQPVTVTLADTTPQWAAGDINHDGSIDASDVTLLVSMILGNMAATADADVNGDSRTDASDVTALVNIILG